MSRLSDQEFLLTDHYKDASNLNARIQLHTRFSTNTYGWKRWAFDRFDFPPECCILELGCGPANLWLENLHRVPEGWEITLSDFSSGILREAQENLSDSGRPFAFEVIDAQEILYDGESFDGVIANHMLYHVPDRAKALSEIHRVLRPGGRFYASTVGQAHMQELYDLVSPFDPDGKYQETRATLSFLLENGLEELSQWFPQTTLHRYEDDLIITEAEPLVAYVLSMAEAKSVFTGDKVAEFTEYVEQQLTMYGAIRITKDSGMFEAFKNTTTNSG